MTLHASAPWMTSGLAGSRAVTPGSGSYWHGALDSGSEQAVNSMCRLFLSPYDLTPSYKSVHNKFSVKYSLNLVLVDEEDRRYFKQQEIQLYRLLEDPPAPATANGSA